MEYEEYLKLLYKRARRYPSNENEDEALKAIARISNELYAHLHDGGIRRLANRSLRGILSTLPEKPTEQDTNRAIHLIEGVILTVISCIFREGKIMIVKEDSKG